MSLTLGSKFEHNEDTRWEFQPSARLLWTLSERQTVWAAVSRAVRTPTILDRDGRVNFNVGPTPSGTPILYSLFGNPGINSEEVAAYELGYRIEPVKRLSLDLTGFYNQYDNLVGYIPGLPEFEAEPPPAHITVPLHTRNSQTAETYGAELSARWQVMEHWRLMGSYSWLHMRLRPNEAPEGDSPQHQFQLRSYVELPYHLELNSALFFVDRVNAQNGHPQNRLNVPSYFRLDVGMTWRPSPSLEVGVWGQNLLDGQHPEYYSVRTSLRTEVPRGVMAKVTWHF